MAGASMTRGAASAGATSGLAGAAAPAADAEPAAKAASAAVNSRLISKPPSLRFGAADAVLRKRHVVHPQVLRGLRVAVALEAHVEAVEARRRKPLAAEVVALAGVSRDGAALHVRDFLAIDPEARLVRRYGHVPLDAGPALQWQRALRLLHAVG